MTRRFKSRITAGDISNVVDPFKVRRLGFAIFAEGSDYSDNAEYTAVIVLEDGRVIKDLRGLDRDTTSLNNINHILSQKNLYFAHFSLAKLSVKGSEVESDYSGDLYKEK